MKKKLRSYAKPALQSAISYLQRGLDTGQWPEGSLLPPINALAAAAGVSRVTMWKAVRHQTAAGKLSSAKGGSRFKSGTAAPAVSTAQPTGTYAWERTRFRILNDIYCGKFSYPPQLPSLGTLQNLYGVHFNTLKKALDSIEKENLIERHQRGYVTPESKRGRNTISIALVGNEEIVNPAPFLRQFIIELEKICTNSHLDLRRIPFNSKEQGAFRRFSLDLAQHHDGIILYVPANAELDSIAFPFGELIKELMNTAKPLSILTESGFMPCAPGSEKHSVGYFSPASFKAGTSVGHAMLKKGRHRGVFISLYHRRQWSLQRFAGLQHVYAAAGSGCQIDLLALNQIWHIYDTIAALSGISPGDYADLMNVDRKKKPVQLAAIQHDYQLLVETLSSGTANRQHDLSMNFPMLLVLDLIKKGIDRKFLCDMHSFVFHWVTEQGGRNLVTPLFEQALADPSVSVWFCANDYIALGALEFLRRRKKKVPGDIAVLGFDNSPDSLLGDLTSYDFDFKSMATRLLSFVLYPGSTPGTLPGTCTEIDGILVERKSTTG